MKKRYFIILSYKGTAYHGWQKQANAITIQEIVESALSTILKTKISLTGAGRTDSGVHASFFVAHFEQERRDISTNIVYKLNRFLPNDIVVHRILNVTPHSHARFSAISRTYTYLICTEKNPFLKDLVFQYFGHLNVNAMNQTSKYILGEHDFTSFSKLHSNNKTDTCKVEMAEWQCHGRFIVFKITADRFLRNMVRSLVGTMLDVGKEKIRPIEFNDIFC